MDACRRAVLLRAQPVFDLGIRPRGAETVPARSQDHAAPRGLVTHDSSFAIERSSDRAELDDKLPLQPVALQATQRSAGQAWHHALDVPKKIPDLGLRPRDDEGLADGDVRLFTGQAQIRLVIGPTAVAPHGSRDRDRRFADRRGGAVRSHWPYLVSCRWRDGKKSGTAFLQYAADGTHDPDIASASAEIAAELKANAALVGVGKTRDDVARGDEHARRTEAALQAMLRGERPSQCGHDGIVLKSLDSGDLRPFAQDSIGDAGSRGLSIDEQRARTAGALLAAQMRAGQAQALAQQVGEIQARLDALENRNAIHGKLDRSHQAIA